MKKVALVIALLVLFSGSGFAGYDFSGIEKNISKFTLPNGLTFILMEDHSVPTATFVTYVNAGGSDERLGLYGASHFIEHMAFKGTEEIGTTDYAKEKTLFVKMDALFEKILDEKGNIKPDKNKLEALNKELEALKKEATQYVVPNEYPNTLDRNGVQGLNAGTSKDATLYYYSLPSNKSELWAYLESARFTNPIFREFYKERSVIMEERRVRIENLPFGKMAEEILSMAFKVHPYRDLGIGSMSNIEHFTRADLYAYFKSKYTARNMVIGVAGDITPKALRKLADKYFSRLTPGKKSRRVLWSEPEQVGEKQITLYEDSQPIMVMAYHMPSVLHEDYPTFTVLSEILSGGRSSRLKKKLEIEDKLVMAIRANQSFPGRKYPALYSIITMPTAKHTNDDVLAAVEKEIKKISDDSITPEELLAAKTRIKVRTLRSLKSRTGLLRRLLSAEMLQGSWETAFEDLKTIDGVTPEMVRTVVKKYLVPSNRTLGRIEKKKEEESK